MGRFHRSGEADSTAVADQIGRMGDFYSLVEGVDRVLSAAAATGSSVRGVFSTHGVGFLGTVGGSFVDIDGSFKSVDRTN
jgi:hypothetical protein